jgi:hypothetical protein
MLNGRWTRTQAPDSDVSSSVAGARKDVPLSSSHVTSADAHITLRGSIVRSSMPTVSARKQGSLVTSEYPSLKLSLTDKHEVVKRTVILMALFFGAGGPMQLCLQRVQRSGLHRSSGLQKAQAIRMTSAAAEAAHFSAQVHCNSEIGLKGVIRRGA